MTEKKNSDFNRRRFLSNSVKLVAGATALANAPKELFALQGDTHAAVLNDPPEQTQADHCDTDFEFNNWDNTLRCEPKLYCEPRSEAEVVDLVQQTYNRRGVIRTFGAGHSWSPVVLTSDTLVNLDKLKRLIAVDQARLRATIQAGARIKEVIKILRKNGLGMKNLGSIKEQSIAGAISTATHGTGLDFGNLSTQVVAMKLVNGRGELRTISEERDPELMAAARTSLGALGIITEVTLQAVKDYKLKYQSKHQPFDVVLDQLNHLLKINQRVRLYWHTLNKKDIKVMTMNPTSEPATSPAQLEAMKKIHIDNGMLEPNPKGTFDLCYWPGLGVQIGINKQKQAQAKVIWLGEEYVAPYDEALTVPMPPHHQESEYAIPVDRAAEAVRLVRKLIEDNHFRDFILVEVRFVDADNIMLSPSYKRRVCYIGGYIFNNPHANDFFRVFEHAMKNLEGKPHWGKHFTLSTQEARQMYPLFDRFNEIRRDWDPRGIFANDLIRNLFNV
jgi:FAD-linked oxidoreductase